MALIISLFITAPKKPTDYVSLVYLDTSRYNNPRVRPILLQP